MLFSFDFISKTMFGCAEVCDRVFFLVTKESGDLDSGLDLWWKLRFEQKECDCDCALGIRLKKLGSKHVDVANSYHNLDTVYHNHATCNG